MGGAGQPPQRQAASLYGKTRKEARDKLREALRDADAGLDVGALRQTVGQFLDRWLADVVAPKLAPKTVASYGEIVRVHLKPELGRRELGRLTPQDVQALLRAKERQGLSPRTVAYIQAVLRVALDQAVKWGVVARNVAALTEPPLAVRVERTPLSPEQARALLKAAEGDRLEALYRVGPALGLRLGEALGLHWADVDLDAGTLRVRFAVQRVGGKLTIKEPKTEKSRRTLTMPPSLAAALRAHRDRQAFERAVAGDGWAESGLVFANTIGGPLEPSNVLVRFKRLLADADLPKQRFQDLRHCAASLLPAQGVPPGVVMDILGHSQMATTMDLYSHVMPAAHQEAAGLIEDILTARG